MANERSELILRVDDLTHKVLRCESEVAVGETFDLVFFGGRVWDGDSAKVFLYDDKERLLWSASGVVAARSDGAFVISGCVIDTEQAAAYANRGDKRGRRVYGELIRVDVEGERTDYGDFSFLLHKGVSADGTPLVKFLDDLSAHEVDGEAHEDIRQEIAQVETSILASVSQDFEEHSVVEETARNEAIHRAMMDLRSELEGGEDGIGAGAVAEATRQAALAGEIAVGVADSARAAAVSAETAAQAAKDGASYLNLIINASKSALASKDQAQAFATSSSEAKKAAEASVASVSSDRVAVEAARDEVLDARNDVIAAQEAVGGLLSSARESEAAARESASTASRAASDAESAKSAAESARDRAVVARDEAEAFAAGAARSAEASEASAVRSEKAAEVSAQEAAQGVTALLQGKVEAAEVAKAGAEAAKTAAETAQAGADAAKTAAASSATSAANSAAAAEKSATDLAEAVATAESLDGRLTAIEPSALRAKDGYIGTMNGTQYPDGAFSFNQFIDTLHNYGTLYTGANFCAWCTGLKWVLASHWDKIGTNAIRECASLTEIKGTMWRTANMNNNSSEIGANAFRNCTNLEKMPPVSNDVKTLESGYWAGVRIINTGAFYNCRKLPAQFVKDIISSPALWSIKGDAFKYCCLDSGGIDELVLGKNVVFNSYGAFAESGVKRVDCSQMVKDPIFDAQFNRSQLEEIVLPQRQFSYSNGFSFLKHLRYVKMPPVEPVSSRGYSLFYWNDYSNIDEVIVEFPITRAEAEAWTKYQLIVLDSFPLEKTVFNFTDEQGVTYNA